MLLFTGTTGISAENSSPRSGVRIRIANTSSIPFSEIIVRFSSQEEKYGPLAAGASTEYRDVAAAYRYEPTTVMANDRRFQQLIIDHFGDETLEPGLYTYILNIHNGDLLSGLLIDSK
jgi:hypothetical protein